MHERPPDLTDAEVAAGLDRDFGLTATALTYLPVGYGGYHWSASAAGRDWFLTAARLAGEDAYQELTATMAGAIALAAAGLRFVVAPRPAADGAPAARLARGWALTVTAFERGEPGHFGAATTPGQRAEVVTMLADLHAQPAGALPARPLRPASRSVLDQALRERGSDWHGGPYADAARTLVSEHAADLERALAEFDALCATAAADGRPPVVTHGEPHPGNLLRQDGRYLLIDWDTAGLAPPERDLWWIVSQSGAEAAQYERLTGREVSTAALELYRMRWDLDDAGLLVADFRAPHQDDEDARTGWDGLRGALGRLSARAWRTAAF